MARVSVLDDYQQVALTSADWSPVLARHEVDVLTEHLEGDALVARLRGSEVVVLMRERTAFPASLLERLPTLRLLVTTGMHNAAIDLEAAWQQGVTVCGTTGSGNGVPELTMGMAIALTRGIAREDAAVRAGGWQHTIGPGLAGLTMGVLGLGRLGTPVAGLARAFGMEVLAWSPHLTPERARGAGAVAADSLAALLEGADVLTIHLPLTEGTRGLVGAVELARMRPTAYLVNTSRGPIVDEAALVEALRVGRLAGAALDVYDQEPLPPGHPLLSLPNTLLLPHIGYVTSDGYRTWFAQVVEDIEAWDAGRPVRILT